MPRKIGILSIPRKVRLGRDAAVIWLLHGKQPMSFENLAKEAAKLSGDNVGAMQKSLKYDVLPFLIRREIVRKLAGDTETYVLHDFEEQQLVLQRAFEDFELLHHRWPAVEEISDSLGAKIGIDPDKVKDLVYRFAPRLKWEPPEEREKITAPKKARLRFELAAWIRAGCEEAGYAKARYPVEEFNRAKKILQEYPHLVPELELFRLETDNADIFRYRFLWPETVRDIVDTSPDPMISTMISMKCFEECVQQLKIEVRKDS